MDGARHISADTPSATSPRQSIVLVAMVDRCVRRPEWGPRPTNAVSRWSLASPASAHRSLPWLGIALSNDEW